MSIEKDLLEKGHNNPKKGAKKVRAMINIFESIIANDIDNFIDPNFEEKEKEKEKEEEEEEE